MPGDRIIFAARYNETANDYLALANTLSSGKINVAEFTSAINGIDEIIPASIVDNEDNYYWTVGVTENCYTFTNANGDVIGYGYSGTNFIMNGENTEWNISLGVSNEASLVPNYQGFSIVNVITNTRAFALGFYNEIYIVGAFATTNMGNHPAGVYIYNYFLDIFKLCESGSSSPYCVYNYGSTATLTATPNEGYVFVNWTENGEVVSTDSEYSFIVTGSRNLQANFAAAHTVSVTVNPENGGTVTGAGTYMDGSTCLLEAISNENFVFANWTINGNVISTSPTYGFTVNSDRELVANFFPYTITATANPEEGGTVSGAGVYEIGDICILTAVANEGYSFVNWTRNGEEVCATPILGFTVTEARHYVANFELSNLTQATNFEEGWNWWSSYIELDDNSLEMLQNSLGMSGEMIKSQNDGYASYLDGFGWYGMLTSINNESTYQVKANTACTMELTGNVTNPADHPIALNPGWTWVGYPVNANMSVEDALAGIIPQSGDMLKSQNDGYASYLDGFGWYGSLNTLQPGMGLMFKSNSGSAMTLTYPDSGARTELKANQTVGNNHWRPNLTAYPDNMSVMAVVELDGEELQGENYELAAFANGECRGSSRLFYVEPLDRYMAFLTIAGDETSELQFSLYNAETGVIETQCIASLQYETNAVVGSFAEPYIVSFRSMMDVDEWVNSLQIFPNPVEKGQTISLGNNEIGVVRVEIINALGMVVETCRGASQQTITVPETVGVYTLRINVEGKGICYRKLVVR